MFFSVFFGWCSLTKVLLFLFFLPGGFLVQFCMGSLSILLVPEDEVKRNICELHSIKYISGVFSVNYSGFL